MTCWAIIVAGGSGSRFGAPKQFEQLGARSVLARAAQTAADCCDGVVVVVAADMIERARIEVAAAAPGAPVIVGGATRAQSVRNGLGSVPAEATIILVHDAARPLAPRSLYMSVIGAVREGASAVVPGVAVIDTIRSRAGGVIDRDQLVAVQTPQGFSADVLRAAHADAPDATDDAGLVEAAGGSVLVVAGASVNLKITTPIDLVVARALLAAGEAT